jgi:hypothetical protein
LFLEPKTSDEEEDIGNINGAGPLGTKRIEEKPRDFRERKDSLKGRLLVKQIHQNRL